MIIKTIATFPSGVKSYFNRTNPILRGLKKNGQRPVLMQIFIKENEPVVQEDIEIICKLAMFSTMPAGRVTINGIHGKESLQSLDKNGYPKYKIQAS